MVPEWSWLFLEWSELYPMCIHITQYFRHSGDKSPTKCEDPAHNTHLITTFFFFWFLFVFFGFLFLVFSWCLLFLVTSLSASFPLFTGEVKRENPHHTHIYVVYKSFYIPTNWNAAGGNIGPTVQPIRSHVYLIIGQWVMLKLHRFLNTLSLLPIYARL